MRHFLDLLDLTPQEINHLLEETGRLKKAYHRGRRKPLLLGRVLGIVFVGDGNNVARTLAICCGKLGVRFVLASPEGYGFDEPFVQTYHRLIPQGELLQNGEPGKAVRSADVIYTDVWTSMGQEKERDR